MSDPKPATPKAEALASKLKESLSKRRIRPWKAVLAALVASVVVLALLTYGFYPRPQPAPLQIMALDIVCTADEALIAAEVDAKASAALTRASKEGWRVVYLSVRGEEANEFRAACAWIAKNQAKLPIGPVLGRPHFVDAESAVAARQAALDSL